jgi:hypothetical protein
LGGTVCAAPVVEGARGASDALNCTLSRPFGAGFGTGTVWAADGGATPTRVTAISNVKAVGMPQQTRRSAAKRFGSVFKTSS